MPLHALADLAMEKQIDTRHVTDIMFFANLLGVNVDLTGLGLIKQQLLMLITQYSLAGGIQETEVRELINSISIMRDMISALKKKVDFFKLKKGYKSKTPIFAFHIAGAGPHDTLKSNYEKFALDINQRLRKIEKEVPKRLEAAARIMRYFINSDYVTEENSLTAQVVKQALPDISKKRKWDKSTYDLWSDFLDKMFTDLEAPEEREGGYKRNANVKYVLIDAIYVTETEGDENTGYHYGVRLNRRYALTKHAAREGEALDEYLEEENVLPFPSPFTAGEKVYSDLPLSVLNYYSYINFWDRRYAKLYHLSLLFYFLFDEYQLSHDSFVFISIFVESALFLGLGIDDLMSIIIGRAESSEEKLSVRQHNNDEDAEEIQLFYSPVRGSISYTIPPRAIGYYEETLISENCHVSGTVCEFKLPKSIDNLFNEIIGICKNQRIGGSTNLLFPKVVRARCYKEIKEFLSTFNTTHEFRLTKESLSRSFQSYFQSRYKCDPVCVSYISAKLDPSTRTQRFYMRVTPEELHQEYYPCYNQFKNDLHKNLIEIGKVDDAIVPFRSLEYLSTIDKTPDADALKDFAAFGSKIVPKLTSLMDFFKKITGILESLPLRSEQERFDYYNLYAIFVYIVLQLASGLRPLADPPINLDCVNFMGNFIYVSDKDSTKYREGRIIHMHFIVMELLQHLAYGARRTLEVLRPMNSENTKFQDKLFYFILPDFRVDELTPEHIRSNLDKHNLADIYDYPLNCM